MTQKIVVSFGRIGDWFTATSKDLPGLIATHPKIQNVYDAVPSLIKMLIKAKEGRDVIVSEEIRLEQHTLDEAVYVAEAA